MEENHIEAGVEHKPDLPVNKSEWTKPELHVLALREALSSSGTGIDITSGRRHTIS